MMSFRWVLYTTLKIEYSIIMLKMCAPIISILFVAITILKLLVKASVSLLLISVFPIS